MPSSTLGKLPSRTPLPGRVGHQRRDHVPWPDLDVAHPDGVVPVEPDGVERLEHADELVPEGVLEGHPAGVEPSRQLEPAVAVLAAQTDALADEQHRRLVALALANHDGAVDRDGVEAMAHRLDRHLIGLVPIALAHRVRARDRGFLDHAKEFEREVRVHRDSRGVSAARPLPG